MYTRRHFEDIADLLNSLRDLDVIDDEILVIIIRQFANHFEKDNKLFDDIRFIKRAIR